MTWWQWLIIILIFVVAWMVMETCSTGPEEWIERECRKRRK